MRPPLVVAVQWLSRVQLSDLGTEACQASLAFTVSHCVLKLMSAGSVMPSNYFILCLPLLLLPSVFPGIRAFSDESVLAPGGQIIGDSASPSVLTMDNPG